MFSVSAFRFFCFYWHKSVFIQKERKKERKEVMNEKCQISPRCTRRDKLIKKAGEQDSEFGSRHEVMSNRRFKGADILCFLFNTVCHTSSNLLVSPSPNCLKCRTQDSYCFYQHSPSARQKHLKKKKKRNEMFFPNFDSRGKACVELFNAMGACYRGSL